MDDLGVNLGMSVANQFGWQITGVCSCVGRGGSCLSEAPGRLRRARDRMTSRRASLAGVTAPPRSHFPGRIPKEEEEGGERLGGAGGIGVLAAFHARTESAPASFFSNQRLQPGGCSSFRKSAEIEARASEPAPTPRGSRPRAGPRQSLLRSTGNSSLGRGRVAAALA